MKGPLKPRLCLLKHIDYMYPFYQSHKFLNLHLESHVAAIMEIIDSEAQTLAFNPYSLVDLVLPEIKNLISGTLNYKIEIFEQYLVMIIVLYRGINICVDFNTSCIHPVSFQYEDKVFLLILQINR